MKRIACLFALSLQILSVLGRSEDIRDKVAVPALRQTISELIDPDTHIYGVPYGTAEDQFIAKYGKPTGYLRLTATESAMCYGQNTAFLFKAGKLSGIRITIRIFDWQLAESIAPSPIFDTIKWRLPNGICSDMTLAEVKRILGDSLRREHYLWSYDTTHAHVDLQFAHAVDQGEKDEAYRVDGLLIRSR
jgi:hypothetical protein